MAQMLTIPEVVNLLRVPETTIRRWIQQGEFPCTIRNGKPLINRTTLISWAEAKHLRLGSSALGKKGNLVSDNLLAALELGDIHYGLKGDDREAVLRDLPGQLQLNKISPQKLETLLLERESQSSTVLGKGVAGAVAGIFNAPLTGLIFTLEIILGEWSVLTVLPSIIAAVTATEFSRVLMGNKITFTHEFEFFDPTSLVACVLLGILTGLVSIAFSRSLSWSEKKFHKVGSPWARAALGGAIIGGMAYLNPSVLGEGYNITQEFLAQMDQHTVDWVLLFILLKFIACCVTLGSGGVGGVFAPSLVLGSAVGMSFGLILGLTGWEGVAEPAAFALVGMAGMVTGVMHGPLTGVFLVMESTGGYSLILPLMLTASSAMVTSSFLEVGSVYTRNLIFKGDLVKRGSDQHLLRSLSRDFRDLLDHDFLTVRDSTLLGEFVEVFKNAHRNYFPVLEADSDRCIGIVFLDDIRSYLFDTHLYNIVSMGSIMRSLPTISTNESIEEALDKFELSGAWALPVMDGKERFLGMLSKSTLFDHYRRELQITV